MDGWTDGCGHRLESIFVSFGNEKAPIRIQSTFVRFDFPSTSSSRCNTNFYEYSTCIQKKAYLPFQLAFKASSFLSSALCLHHVQLIALNSMNSSEIQPISWKTLHEWSKRSESEKYVCPLPSGVSLYISLLPKM